MSFSSDVKAELKEQLSDARHCRIAEFAAIFALSGHIKKDKEGNTYLEIHTENLTVAQKSYILLKCTFNADVEIDIRNHDLQGFHIQFFQSVFHLRNAFSRVVNNNRIRAFHGCNFSAIRFHRFQDFHQFVGFGVLNLEIFTYQRRIVFFGKQFVRNFLLLFLLG